MNQQDAQYKIGNLVPVAILTATTGRLSDSSEEAFNANSYAHSITSDILIILARSSKSACVHGAQ